MAATTFVAFRTEMFAAIDAITPTTPLHDRTPAFRLADDEVDFREWAPNNPDACTRMYTIYDLLDDDPIEITDATSDLQPIRCEVLVAYQHDYKYGAAKQRARQDVIRQDYRLLESALGVNGSANYTNGSTLKEDSPFDVELYKDHGVSILVIPYLVRIFQSV